MPRAAGTWELLQWEIAKLQAHEDFGITDDMWKEIPDTRFNG